MSGFERAGDVQARIADNLAAIEIGRRELETAPAWCAGERRPHSYPRQLFRIVNNAGHVGIGVACGRCGQGRRLLDQNHLRAAGLDLTRLETLDDTSTTTRCARCGRAGAEEHHWAPRALFDDADSWPTDPLCPACHARWHQVTGTNGTGKEAAINRSAA